MMNRLILIGNGFDLAHGLKTSYKDFILSYIADCLCCAGYNSIYEDDLIRIKSSDIFSIQAELNGFDNNLYNSDLTISRYRDYILNHYDSKTLDEFLNIKEPYGYYDAKTSGDFDNEEYKEAFIVETKSSLLKSLILNCLECNWVDIENQYFDELLGLGGDLIHKNFDADDVQQLNSEFEYLKTKLEEYLSLEEKRHTIVPNQNILQILNSSFKVEDFDTVMDRNLLINEWLSDLAKGNKNNHKAYVLNFNYTNTLSKYVGEIRGEYFVDTQLNHIHGKLNDPLNPIIFGFGDEHDKEYLQFEEQRLNALFDHIKSYQYLRTANYRNLVRFLNEDNYQVFVMGHSCGLSDRTMFKEIFDHNNCKSIKIFHHKRDDGSTDFHEKVVNISRHFSDKGHMRKLIVEFNEADCLPQSN